MRFSLIISILISTIFLVYGIFNVVEYKNERGFVNFRKSNDIDQNEFKKLIKKKVEPVDLKKDLVLGSKDAEIFIVEYFDMESDKSAMFFENIQKLESKWISSKKVAFVFRIFPLKQFEGKYKSAFIEDKAVLCVGQNFGVEKMQYLREKIYNETKFDGNFSREKIVKIVSKIIPNEEKFLECLDNSKKDVFLEHSRKEAVEAGIMGTPYVFIQLPEEQIFQSPPDFETIDASLESYFINE